MVIRLGRGRTGRPAGPSPVTGRGPRRAAGAKPDATKNPAPGSAGEVSRSGRTAATSPARSQNVERPYPLGGYGPARRTARPADCASRHNATRHDTTRHDTTRHDDMRRAQPAVEIEARDRRMIFTQGDGIILAQDLGPVDFGVRRQLGGRVRRPDDGQRAPFRRHALHCLDYLGRDLASGLQLLNPGRGPYSRSRSLGPTIGKGPGRNPSMALERHAEGAG